MSACKSCGASILWATGAASGRVMPLNLPPDPEGLLHVGPDGKVREYADNLLPGKRYTSHFATCPQANTWRKPGAHRKS